jgi:hypothetical protein
MQPGGIRRRIATRLLDMQMQDYFSISGVGQALAEAACWCRLQNLTAEPPLTEEDRRQRALIVEAGKRNSESYRRTNKADKRASEILATIGFQSFTKLRSQLRSPSLKPSIDIHEKFEEPPQELAVREVIMRRSELLASQVGREELSVPAKTEGSILIYMPNETVFDGASEAGSEGFFDDYDAPPWDTWFHYHKGKLFCWVPSVLIPLAQAGIDGNPVQCIEWAEWSVLDQFDSQ